MIQATRAYLEMLRKQTAWINIRGLQVGSETALRVPIGEIYIPLTMAGGKGAEEDIRRRAKTPAGAKIEARPPELEEALEHPRLVIVGDPGSGKSTFLQRVAFALAEDSLAGHALAGLPDEEQHAFLIGGGKIYRPEWREVMLLLGGVLMEQGRAKVDSLVSAILSHLGENPTLAERARCAGLIGAMALDLRPLDYQVKDVRYRLGLNALLPMFESAHAASVDLQVRVESAEALGQAGDPRLQRENWVTIPAGKFLMGAQKKSPQEPNYDDKTDEQDEIPVHEVSLRAFRIGRYPVTVEEFRRFMEEKGYENQIFWQAGGFGQKAGPAGWEDQLLYPNRPVVGVNWYEAAAWCAWSGGRLPTEAEWERAARGTEGRKYPWGNESPDASRTNYDETKVGHASPIGLFPKGMTPEGLHDMAGNVWEWCSDWYSADYYGQSPHENPQGPKNGNSRVLRGGSWFYHSMNLRAALRYSYVPANRYDDFGFRCVREVRL